MARHPLHPATVHAPIACVVFAPLSDGAALWLDSRFWFVGALCAGAATVLGAVAAMFGAADFDKGFEKAPRTVTWHAVMMASAVLLSGIGLLGRVDGNFNVIGPASAWAIAASLIALLAVLLGGYLGGEMVYGRAISVRLDER